jgi:uncharacterized membrane protein YfbV (UPF0208 family)
MTPEQAGAHITSALAVTREDIARAKNWIAQAKGHRPDQMANTWISEQSIEMPRKVDTDAGDCSEVLSNVARAYSPYLAFFQAVWELVVAGDLIPAGPPDEWKPSLEFKTSHYAGGIPLAIAFPYPQSFVRPPWISGEPSDPDIFLKGINCNTLHSGVREAIEQSLNCFRRGLYMPATVMLAAAAEAIWTECGAAVAKKLSNTKLSSVIGDQYSSISKKITELQNALAQANGKSLLKDAGQNNAKVDEAEVWMTVLRDRRNALHWGKAKSFVADHAETASLLMGAPLHFATLEAIRGACV